MLGLQSVNNLFRVKGQQARPLQKRPNAPAAIAEIDVLFDFVQFLAEIRQRFRDRGGGSGRRRGRWWRRRWWFRPTSHDFNHRLLPQARQARSFDGPHLQDNGVCSKPGPDLGDRFFSRGGEKRNGFGSCAAHVIPGKG